MKAKKFIPSVGCSFIATHSINEVKKVYNHKPIKKGDIITVNNILNGDSFECENIDSLLSLFTLNKFFKPFEC